MNDIKKEILYRSIHRGCKETDHLIGGFAKDQVDKLKQEELAIFKDLIVEDDMQIYDWILKKVEMPPKYQKLITKIREFHRV